MSELARVIAIQWLKETALKVSFILILILLALSLLGLLNGLFADSLTLNGPGATYHAFLHPSDYTPMHNRIGANSVFHEKEVGLTYRTGYFQIGGDYLHDCFDGHAGAFYLGPSVPFWTYFTAGGILGVYAREHRIARDMPLKAKVGKADVMPLGGFTFAISVPISRHLGVELNTLLNGFVNHANIGLKVSW